MSANDIAVSKAAREVVITRDFAAPPHLVFRAFSEPEHLLKWFGPGEWPLTSCEIDFRVGGRIRMAMTGPGGEAGPPFGGSYREIVPDRKIVYDNGFLRPDAGRMVVTVVFEPVAGGTRMTHTTVFDDDASFDYHVDLGFAQGTAMGFDQLGVYLTQMQVGASS